MKSILKHHYCDLCGKKIPVRDMWGSEKYRCDKCRNLSLKVSVKSVVGKNRFCIYCKKPLKNRVRFCCNPNADSARSKFLMKKHPEKIRILKKCNCDKKKKVKHHPDHHFPYDVYLLCYSCHFKEHNPYGHRWGVEIYKSIEPGNRLAAGGGKRVPRQAQGGNQ